MAADHNSAIAKAARAALQPLGCTQKGRSRVWLDDRGWWVGVVEFQPSGFSKMSYLNVGACFLWSGHPHFSFDDGPDECGIRRPESARVATDPTFERSATMLAAAARADVLQLRLRHADVHSTMQALQSTELARPWGYFHLAMASGLAGNVESADRAFARVIDPKAARDWEQALSARAEVLRATLCDVARFRAAVLDSIEQSRLRLKLPPRAIAFDA